MRRERDSEGRAEDHVGQDRRPRALRDHDRSGRRSYHEGSPPSTPAALTSPQDESLSRQVPDGIGKLKSLQCGGTFPDEATYSIAALGKTVAVRGTCEPGFTKLWNALTNALGLNA